MTRPDVVALGDSATLLRFGPGGEDAACAAGESVRRAEMPGLRDVVVAYDSVALHFDPLITTSEALVDLALRGPVAGSAGPGPDLKRHSIRVHYDGPDLPRVAAACGLSPADVVALHASMEYRVLAVGFVPGFAYLGDIDKRLRLPRRDAPRPRVPAGSVAIAGSQTAVYPFVTPGGWHLIGRTDTVMFDPNRAPASRLSVGARVRFVPS